MSGKLKLAIIVCLGAAWLFYSHSFGAYNYAKREARASSSTLTGSAFGFGTPGYLRYCKNAKSKIINAAISQKKKEVASQFREREASVLGLSFLNSLLGQSFGDKNYENYKKKYGTNPFNALTGGALGKAPGALGKIVAANKQQALQKVQALEVAMRKRAETLCHCQFAEAFKETHGSWTVLAATLGFLRTSSIEKRNFFQTADVKGKACS